MYFKDLISNLIFRVACPSAAMMRKILSFFYLKFWQCLHWFCCMKPKVTIIANGLKEGYPLSLFWQRFQGYCCESDMALEIMSPVPLRKNNEGFKNWKQTNFFYFLCWFFVCLLEIDCLLFTKTYSLIQVSTRKICLLHIWKYLLFLFNFLSLLWYL